jgi:GNAT superfamily N-acetyltransferase
MDRAAGRGHGAHLRWFIASPEIQGKGWGGPLIDAAMDFCRDKGYEKVYLWTCEGLTPARRLYEKAGFRLVEQHVGRQWGKEVNEQRFEALLS